MAAVGMPLGIASGRDTDAMYTRRSALREAPWETLLITRIARSTVAPNAEAAVFEIVRKMAETAPPGLVSFSINRKVRGQTIELVTVTTWADPQAMVDALGRDLDKPKWPATLLERLVDRSIEVLETVAASAGELDGLDAGPAPSAR